MPCSDSPELDGHSQVVRHRANRQVGGRGARAQRRGRTCGRLSGRARGPDLSLESARRPPPPPSPGARLVCLPCWAATPRTHIPGGLVRMVDNSWGPWPRRPTPALGAWAASSDGGREGGVRDGASGRGVVYDFESRARNGGHTSASKSSFPSRPTGPCGTPTCREAGAPGAALRCVALGQRLAPGTEEGGRRGPAAGVVGAERGVRHDAGPAEPKGGSVGLACKAAAWAEQVARGRACPPSIAVWLTVCCAVRAMRGRHARAPM